MARRFSSNTVRTVGALLPLDILAKAMAGEGLEGLESKSYAIDPEVRFRDVVNNAWNEARALWWNFQADLRDLSDEDASASSLTREKWLIPLFELLGFDDIQVEAKSLEVSGTDYPISHSWAGTPLHLMGARVDLDGRISGIPGAARLSPHSLLQQFLNRSDDHLWGVVSNGLQLRVLRDSVSLTRQAFVQFDLEALFNGEVFPDFVLLYRTVHATRFKGERPEECLLERWIAAARDEGIRALDQLRDGVEAALTELGSGFLSHPNNSQLRKMVAEEDLDARVIYRYLLRVVYRLLFLFVAEDRDLLLAPETDPETRDRYDRFYSTARIRDLASRPTTPGHGDLWAGLVALMNILGKDEGEPALGLPGLGSFLWGFDAIGPLIDSDIDNDRLLEAIRSLAFVEEAESLRRIDFAALGAEELGSVYESLLELHPHIDSGQKAFSLAEGAGSERKTTGSYYTPTELISELLDSALDPVLEEAARKDDPEKAILELKVVDPAAGSGHFLVAAAHRIAKRLAEVRTGEPEPPEDEYRTAIRDVVSRCLFAVDINDLAVELCKVSLWLEALEPGKPLSFLDHHILHGNSLFGATPAVIADGIPMEAFVALTGDDKTVVSALKKRNREERSGQEELAFETGEVISIGAELKALEGLEDSDLQTVRAKETMLAAWKASAKYAHAKLVADAWCAAFAIAKDSDAPQLTDGVFRRLRDDGTVGSELRKEIEELAGQHRFFHWHLGFPQVFQVDAESSQEPPGWGEGFDVVLGNPPWERMNFEEVPFFSVRSPEIAALRTSERRKRIRNLKESAPELHAEYRESLREAEVWVHFVKTSGRFPHSSTSRPNTYIVFLSTALDIANPKGTIGMVVPSGLALDDTGRRLFSHLLEKKQLSSLFDFENRARLFPTVDSRFRFSLVTLSKAGEREEPAVFVFMARSVGETKEESRRVQFGNEDLETISPLTGLAPAVTSTHDLSLLLRAYSRSPALIVQERRGLSGWGASDFLIMLISASHSDMYREVDELDATKKDPRSQSVISREGVFAPVYEAKFIHQFDHRYATFVGLSVEERRKGRARELEAWERDASDLPEPRYWIAASEVDSLLQARDYDREWFAGYRDITNATNERTSIAAIIPRAGAAQPLNLFLPETAEHGAAWVAAMNSFAIDFVVRQRIGGTHLNITTARQLPIPAPTLHVEQLRPHLLASVVELSATSPSLACFSRELGFGSSWYGWNAERRKSLRAELDAMHFAFFGFTRDDVSHVMETFPIVRRYDMKEYGSYRTKELILDVYDRMSGSIESGESYQTILDPPPADPSLRVNVEAPR